jgi:hypothetical protein
MELFDTNIETIRTIRIVLFVIFFMIFYSISKTLHPVIPALISYLLMSIYFPQIIIN